MEKPLSETEKFILDSLQSIRYGALEVTVHDSRIVQVQKSEKTRFDPPRTS